MRNRGYLPSALFVASLSASSLGCIDQFPEKVALKPEAANVEIVTETPNEDVYEPAGEVAAQVKGRDVGEAFRQAFNELRNAAAAKGATFVAVEEADSRASWDLSGRTVVTVVGTAYKTK